MRALVTGFACLVALSATSFANQNFRLVVQGATNPSVTYKTDAGASEKATGIGSNVYLIEDLNGSSKVGFQVEATDGTSTVYTGEFILPNDVVHMAVVQLGANGEMKATFPDARSLLSDGTGTSGFNGLPSCATGVYCQIPDALGHGAGGTIGATSDANSGAGFVVSDSFEAQATTDITDICWWGLYVDFGLLIDCGPGVNQFTVTYFSDAGGLPGAVIGGPFTDPADNFFDTGNDIATGIGPINEYQYELSHAAVSVNSGDIVHIQIQANTDPTTCFWLWSTAPPGDGAGVQDGVATDYDLGFCVNIPAGPPPPPPAAGNDNCANALAISGNGPHAFDNSSATDDGLDDPLCDFFGSSAIPQDVWFCWTSGGSGTTRMETCGQTTVDTKIAVYDGCSCPSGTGILACNDDDCGLQSGLSFNATAGNTYLLRVGTFPGATGGTGTFTMTQISIPANDDCANAIAVAVPSGTPGTTEFATTDSEGFPFCGTGITSPGVWYSVTGTGNTITASLCDGNTAFDSKISVYCGDCADPANALCVDGNDDFCGLQSEISWCSQAGATYLVLVHGFGGATGTFELDISDDGVSCTADVACLPQGACCIDIGGGQIDCQIATADDCAALGGTYQGDDTGCPTKEYFEFSCTQAFEQIANTGSPLFLGDDDGALVPLGFTFNFFEQSYSTIGVGSNGYLTFGTDLTDFSNDPIPDDNDPNDIICPLWDDLDPSSGGQVYVATFGVAPNRAFVAQWDNVPQFGNTDSNTFQAILFENSSRISFRYLNITPEAFAGDYTVGVENVDGTRGTAVDASTIFNGDCRLLIPDTIPGDCTAPLPLDVRPGFCPNPVVPNANGVVTVTVPGTVSVNPANATMVDGTVQLELAGGGAPVQPYRRSPASLTYVVGDSVTPFFGSNCNVSGPDGIDDWTFEFSVADLRDAFGLSGMNPGDAVQVQLTGRVDQGGSAQAFVAYDEMTVSAAPQGTRVRIISRYNGLFTPTSTDLVGDAGAFGGQAATRFVQPGSTFSVTAGPLPHNPGFVWVGWYMDGQFLTSNATANIVVGNDNVALTPVYIFVKTAGVASNF